MMWSVHAMQSYFLFLIYLMQKPGGIIALLDETWYVQIIVNIPFSVRIPKNY